MDKRKIITVIIAAILLFAAVFSAVMCGIQIADAGRNKKEFKALREELTEIENRKAAEEKENQGNSITGNGHPEKKEDHSPFSEYQTFYEKNNDFTGWIRIEDTRVDYPVMQTPDRPNFYLNHSFDKRESSYGTLYADEKCDPDESNNIVIYGHNMKNGSMFHDLLQYTDEEFCREHPAVEFNTLHRYGTYEVFAAFRFDADNDPFRYNRYYDMDPETFDMYVEECRKRSIYDTGIDVEYGDTVLTLSTCEYTYRNGRFVLVARKKKESRSGSEIYGD